MKVVVTGSSGFIGAPLCRELATAGHKVVALSRNEASARKAIGTLKVEIIRTAGSVPTVRLTGTVGTVGTGIQVVRWDPGAGEIPLSAIEGADAIVNLAGESVAAGRWTRERKERILTSRIQAVRGLIETIRKAANPPKVLVNASAIGFYGPHGDEEIREDDPPGDDFLARVGVAWEAEARKAEALGLRVVLVRLGVALGEDGGALARMVAPFKLFLGGPMGTGRQWFSWIHRDDVIGIIRFALEHAEIQGPVNATGPEPLTMRDFSKTLGKVLGRPSWLPVPGFLLRTALGEVSDMLLTGQRVLPARATAAGYRFRFETAEAALRDIFADTVDGRADRTWR
jgi:uncharacterized protein (TIGR01777 family)